MIKLPSKAVSGAISVIAIALMCLGAGSAEAATPPGLRLTLSPTSLKYELDAGKSTSGTLTLINEGTESYDLNIYSTPYNVSGEDYNQSFELKPAQTDVSAWIKTSAVPLHLEPGKHAEVPYEITVPVGVGPRGYYAAIFAETKQAPAPNSSGVISKKRVGAVLYLRVNGAVDEQGSLASFKTDFWQTEPPLKTVLRLSNQGNVHYQADVSVYVADLFGNVKAKLQTSHIVLPQTIRRIDQAWAGAPPFGLFKVFGTVNMLGRTESLGTHYVLIMSSLFFVIVVIFVSVVLVVCVILAIRQRRTKAKKPKSPTSSPPAPRPTPKPPLRRL